MALKFSDNKFRLCFVDSHIMYFTDNFDNQWGDDWDDSPYYCNAGTPYEYRDNRSEELNKNAGHIRYLAYLPRKYECDVRTPDEFNDYYSVADVNGGAVAWIFHRDNKTSLMAGATIEEAIKWCKDNDVRVGELM